MTQLSTKIKLYANKEVDFRNEVKLQDDGNGAYIKEWNLNIPEPTMAQLDALENQAQVYENNLQQVAKRQSEYGSIAKQIEFITENGIDAWQTKVAEIKAKYPKE